MEGSASSPLSFWEVVNVCAMLKGTDLCDFHNPSLKYFEAIPATLAGVLLEERRLDANVSKFLTSLLSRGASRYFTRATVSSGYRLCNV
jgi:hypothetical protein